MVHVLSASIDTELRGNIGTEIIMTGHRLLDAGLLDLFPIPALRYLWPDFEVLNGELWRVTLSKVNKRYWDYRFKCCERSVRH